MSFQDWIFRIHLRRQAQRKTVIHAWENARTIAILHDSGDTHTIVSELEKGNRHVHCFAMPDKHEITTFTGKPKASVIAKLQSYQYDLLIDLTQQPNITMLYLTMYARADFKVGKHIDAGVYDMTIDTPPRDNHNYLYEQIVKYIQMFSTKK